MCAENMASEKSDALAKKRLIMFNGKMVPWVAVKGDGGWCKRVYGHSYNAKSGVVIILSADTGKILYLGVKNVYCSTCEYAKRNNRTPSEHMCFVNHNGSASKMEQDAIVDGFRHAYEEYGLMFRYFVGDGDSSTMASIRDRVPYGHHVVKIECANHATRNFCTKVHNLSTNAQHKLDHRAILTTGAEGDNIPRVDRLVTGARGAIEAAGVIQKACAGSWEVSQTAKSQLEEDLKNLPYHVLGRHTGCHERYCTRKDKNEEDV
ncbi:hypothetical protein FOCC_FOCC007296, partial [Frankliniella occidentalis]